MNPGFTGGRFARDDHERDDPAALARAIADPRARLLRLHSLEPALDGADRLVWEPAGDAAADAILIGRDATGPIFAIGDGQPCPPARRSAMLAEALAALPADELALYGAARSLIDWHARHGFCGNCGSVTDPARAGWARRCRGCDTLHFPRTDPVVIMLAEHDGRVLLGRQPSWPEGRYSALAGFVEVGESIEEAVTREIAEEAGVVVGHVRYVASQPWPFPSQLMIACIAQADDPTIRIDTTELEHAFWASRADVATALAGEPGRFTAPPAYAIANTLLARWVEGGSGGR